MRLDYHRGLGAEQCPERAALQQAVAARLGYLPWAAPDAPDARTVQVSIEARGQTLRGRVALSASGAPQGERELHSDSRDCRELAQAIELAVAMAIDPEILTRPAAPSSQAATAASAGEPRPDEPASRPADAEPWPLRLRLGLGATLSLGATPGPGVGVAGAVGGEWKPFSLELGLRGELPGTLRLPSGAGVSAGLLTGSLTPCLHLGWFAACGVIIGGALQAAGQDLIDSRNVTSPYLAAGPRLALEIPIVSVLSGRAFVEGLFPLTRIRLQDSGDGSALWTSPPVSGRVGLEALAAFP